MVVEVASLNLFDAAGKQHGFRGIHLTCTRRLCCTHVLSNPPPLALSIDGEVYTEINEFTQLLDNYPLSL